MSQLTPHFENCIHRACSSALLSIAAPVEVCVHLQGCRPSLFQHPPPLRRHGCPLRVQLKDQHVQRGDGWLSTRVFQVFGGTFNAVGEFVTQKNHRALSVPLHLSFLLKNGHMCLYTSQLATRPPYLRSIRKILLEKKLW